VSLTLYPVPGKAKSDMICRAFAAGAPRNADGAVFFGTEGQMSAFKRAKAGGRPWFYVDNSYFDKHRGIYFRVTKNALQVDPRGKTSDGSRFAKLGVEIKPWRRGDAGVILLCPQSDDFMKSTLGFKFDWTGNVLERLSKMAGFPRSAHGVKIRKWNRDKAEANATLFNLLPDVRLLISHSSSASITAMLEGVPTISEAGAAHALTGPLTEGSLGSPPRPEGRLEFARVLADNQFTLDEFRNGTAWKWLASN
jgi:hypothetical protein